MNAVLIAFLLGLLIGLACNRRAVARRSEIIRWAGEDIERYAHEVARTDHIDMLRERWRDLALRAMHRAGDQT
jgi:hypothetical protein